MTYTSDDFKAAAQTTFQNLKGAFQQSVNFWQLGHSFDTIIDYLVTNPTDANGFAAIALDRYNYSLNPAKTACWYDDYGWWGIAALKASQHSDLFGTLTSNFMDITNFCWKTMDDNAPNVWERADKSLFGTLEPLFVGGVWNYGHGSETRQVRLTPVKRKT